MIRENQRLLNHLNMALDALLVFVSMPLGFFVRFCLLPGGVASVPLSQYLRAALVLAPAHVLLYAFFGLYESVRKKQFLRDLGTLLGANALGLVLFQMALFLFRGIHFSRWALFFYFLFLNAFTAGKRFATQKVLHHFRQQGYNQKRVVLAGAGPLARQYAAQLETDAQLGYRLVGYLAQAGDWDGQSWLGPFEEAEAVLDRLSPDEVVAALEMEDYSRMPQLIAACEKTGVKLSLIPFYGQYIPSHPQIDAVGDIPLINLRRIPLDNLGNAFLKRTMDIVGALVLLLVTSPVLLLTAVGVKLSSPGPVIFKQQRVGRGKRLFWMYKFRSMRVNDSSDTAWSAAGDSRRTRFGALIRRFSIDELPQLWNVLRGDMSLVGPRPELPHYVEQFKEEVPLYMVKHQVRPGMTGWAQVNGLRGNTSIPERIRHDVYYIENWSPLFDVKILLMTLFHGVAEEETLI